MLYLAAAETLFTTNMPDHNWFQGVFENNMTENSGSIAIHHKLNSMMMSFGSVFFPEVEVKFYWHWRIICLESRSLNGGTQSYRYIHIVNPFPAPFEDWISWETNNTRALVKKLLSEEMNYKITFRVKETWQAAGTLGIWDLGNLSVFTPEGIIR